MTVIEQREPQETLSENEEVVAELTDGMKLIKTDEGTGIVRPEPESGKRERRYEQWTDATLFFGLWLETGGWTDNHPTTGVRQIPIDVVSAGKDAVAAYILVGTGTKTPRRRVADLLDVSEQTVSNYANRVRWSDD